LVFATDAASASFPGANGKIAFMTGQATDIYVVNPDGTGFANLTNSPEKESDPAWSADGTRIAFSRDCRIYVANADGTAPTPVTSSSPPGCHTKPAWSGTGTEIAFVNLVGGGQGGNIHIIGAAGTGLRTLTAESVHEDAPDWSPDGSSIVYTRDDQALNYTLLTIRPDGSGRTVIGGGFQPHWSADGGRLSFTRCCSSADTVIHTSRPDGSDVRQLPLTGNYSDAAWSPEGGEFVVWDRTGGIAIIGENGLQPRRIAGGADYRAPDWQPLPPAPVPPGYPRPRGATPLRVPLVPAFEECTAPNNTHGPPLAFRSCAAPVESSPSLTVGTADTNGLPSGLVGSVLYRVMTGDVEVTASVTDVRCRTADVLTCSGGALSDYTGELEATSTIRVTDRASSHTATIPGTMDHFQFPIRIPCTATESTSGSTCQVTTTFNTILPGAVVDGKRAIWELPRVEVRDGGPDGSANTDDYSRFLVQGVFIP
jgi:Tol biopolymer transport system component